MATSRPVLSWPSVCDHDAAAQVVEHQGLMGLGQTEFPRQPGVLDGGLRAGAGAAVVAADQDDIGVALGDTRGNGADSHFGDQFHADPGVACWRS